MPDSDYPWITIEHSSGGKGSMGWTIAECSICEQNSGDNAEPYTAYWTHEHALICHPRWSVRLGQCKPCIDEARYGDGQPGNGAGGRPVWVVRDHRGGEFGCRPTHAEAVEYATRKATALLRSGLIADGARP